MADVTLTAEIRANVDQLNKNISAAVSTVQQGARQIDQSASNAAKAISKIPGSSNTAAFALTNLVRVAQDAPFGFIAIQNNINPLLESFQRLREESGSNASALKLLGQSFLGPAGIGVAVSLVTAGITYFIQAQQRAASALKNVKKQGDDYVSTLSDIRQAEVKGQELGEQATTRLNLLYAATQNSTLAIKERNAAYDELNKLYPKTFTLEQRQTTLLGQNSSAYYSLRDAILAAAQARAYENQIGVVSNQVFTERQKLGDLTEQEIKQRAEVLRLKKLSELPSSSGGTGGSSGQGYAILQARAEERLTETLKAKDDVLNSITKKQLTINDLLKLATDSESSANFKTISELDDKTKAQTVIQQLQEQLNKLTEAEQQYIAQGGKQFETLKDGTIVLRDRQRQIAALTDEIEKLNNAVGKDLKTPDLSVTFDPLKNLDNSLTAPKQLGKGDKLSIDNTEYIKQQKLATAAYMEQRDVIKELNQVVGQGLTDAFQTALSGTQSFVSAMGAFIGQLITRLLAAVAAAALLAVVLSAVGFGGGIAGAASSFGSFKNLFSSFSGLKLASGGVVSKPTIAMIGEGGEPEAVIPLSKLDGMMNNKQSAPTGQVRFEIQGNKLIGVLNRAEKTKTRTT